MGWPRLNKKEIPYLITIFVAIVGWSITHVADRVLKAPVVEYSTEINAATEPRSMTVTILNLSNKSFANLKFELQGNGIKACNVPMRFEPPAWASNSAPEQGTNGVGYLISQLQPNWRVTMCGEYRGGQGNDPLFVLKDGGKDQSIELRRPDLSSWILKNETCLMVALAAMGILGILIWIIFGSEAK